jgi:two-component system chemotaxis response regulator CheB
LASIPPDANSGWSRLPAFEVRGAETIAPSRIYVAPPNIHILLDDGAVDIWRGPKENSHRPAIHPLFRSAAVRYGPRVIGVVLSGALDGGSAGLWWVKRDGGVTIVQDPKTAEHPDMPRNAIQYVDVDYVVPMDKITGLLSTLVSHRTEPRMSGVEEDLRSWSSSKYL